MACGRCPHALRGYKTRPTAHPLLHLQALLQAPMRTLLLVSCIPPDMNNRYTHPRAHRNPAALHASC